jgi:ppGpp synthetase/RelA/SpoT-type nucleotidyltranferase
MAGDTLVTWKWGQDEELIFDEAFNKIAAFRATHAYPLRIVTTILRQRARAVDPSATVYARTKRMASIIAKLVRTPSMQTTTMQDLVGCRAVVGTIEAVKSLAEQFRDIAPKLDDPREYNYVEHPKPDGYRSMHFVVKYVPKSRLFQATPSRRVEIQIRSILQHKWATALETIDLFTAQTLKTGGGLHFWKRFFALTSSLFAMKENCPVVPDSAANSEELLQEARGLWTGLRIRDQFNGWITAAQTLIPQEHGTNAMYLIEIDVDKKTTNVKVFSNLREAYQEYGNAERKNQLFQGRSAVLVSALSVNQLRGAFPSYYGDTKAFLDEVEGIVR